MNIWSIKNKIDNIRELSILKTIFINFYFFPIKIAIKFPVFLAKTIKIKDLSGKIILNGEISTGMIKIGLYGRHIFPSKNFGSIAIKGNLIFNGGDIKIGRGCEIVVAKNAKLIIGKSVRTNKEVKLICKNYIEIGDYTRIGWESQLMDSNFHFVINKDTGATKNILGEIVIANNNWIGNRCSIMKDTYTSPFSIFASNSLLNKNFTENSYCIYAGSPAKKIAEGFYQAIDNEEKILKEKFNIVE